MFPMFFFLKHLIQYYLLVHNQQYMVFLLIKGYWEMNMIFDLPAAIVIIKYVNDYRTACGD